jgi:Transglutaminase-like superfamily
MQSFWRRCRRRFRALARMSWSDRALAAESLAMLAAARLLVKTTPRERLASRMGGVPANDTDCLESVDASNTLRSQQGVTGARVGKMVERAARTTWWRSMCLEKALAGKWMLRRRGISSTMYVGVAKRGTEFIAHAWLVGDGQTLTGAGKTVYATLAAFREPRA